MPRNYSTPLAADLMRAYREGWRKGAFSHSIVGWSIGMVLGFGLAMYAGTKLEQKDKTEETNK